MSKKVVLVLSLLLILHYSLSAAKYLGINKGSTGVIDPHSTKTLRCVLMQPENSKAAEKTFKPDVNLTDQDITVKLAYNNTIPLAKAVSAGSVSVLKNKVIFDNKREFIFSVDIENLSDDPIIVRINRFLPIDAFLGYPENEDFLELNTSFATTFFRNVEYIDADTLLNINKPLITENFNKDQQKIRDWYQAQTKSIATGAEQIRKLSDTMIIVRKDGIDIDINSTHESSFYACKYEVTQAQWLLIMGNNPSYFRNLESLWHRDRMYLNNPKKLKEDDSLIDWDNLPVENISFNDAIIFCNKLSINQGLTPYYSVNGYTNPDQWAKDFKPFINIGANGYRLLTSAEWNILSSSGSGYIWDNVNSYGHTQPVGIKSPNSLGIFDILGNVSEWCISDGNTGVVKGGNYSASANNPERHRRGYNFRKNNKTGLRLARSVK